jgi:hypothetical protein
LYQLSAELFQVLKSSTMSDIQRISSTDEDRPFQHYNMKHRVISWVSRTLFDRHTYTVRHGLLRGMKRKGGLGWLPEAAAEGHLFATAAAGSMASAYGEV